MARSLRISYPHAYYHVMHRGAGRRDIFCHPRDGELFLELLDEIHRRFQFHILAFSLMRNHYHLVLSTPLGNVSRGMRHLNGVYTLRWNRQHKTDGPLFRGRFKAILIEKEDYLAEVIRYVHLNPVRARVVRDPEEHPWTSHRGYLARKNPWPWLRREEILRNFSRKGKQAQRLYRQYMEAAPPKSIQELYGGRKLPAVLGGKRFMEKVRRMLPRKDEEIPEAKELRGAVPLEEILRAVGREFAVAPESLKRRRRGDENVPRNVALYLARELSGRKLPEIAEWFVLGGASGVSQAASSFQRRLGSARVLQRTVERLSESLLSRAKQT